MLKFIEKNNTLVIVAAGGLLVAYLLNKYMGKASSSTLAQGLSNPINALGALAGSIVGIEPTVTGGTQLTENFDYYIKLNGGIDKYLAAKKNGTFTGQPYNQNIDYKKLYQNSNNNPLSVFFL